MRNLAVLNLLIGFAFAPLAIAYEPPIGIPYPAFGIDESHTMYSGQAGYSDAGNGPYTIYVDSTASNCSNSGPATAQQPRCDLPSSLSAGDVLEVHGGPYTKIDPVLTSNGTAAKPIFIRGIDDGNGAPKIKNSNQIKLYGQYFVFEGFDLDKTRMLLGFSDGHAEFAAARNNRIHDHASKNGSNLYGDNLLFWENEVDHNQGNDRHGTYVGSGSFRVWILDNYYHHNGGDAVQFCHGCSSNPPDTVFIGRNLMHSDRENGVDLKYSRNIVISENTIHSYAKAEKDKNWCFDDGSGCGVYSSGSDGAAVVVGSDGAPTNVWVMFNRIYDSNTGIRIEEAGSNVNIIGNLVYDLNSSGLALQKRGEPVNLIGNTFYDMKTGIDQYWRENFDLVVKDNIFLDIDKSINYEDRDVAEQSVLESNIFWNSTGSVSVNWPNNQSISSSAQLNGLSGEVKVDNQLANPNLVSLGSTPDFSPRAGSTAIDSATSTLAQFDAVYRGMFEGATTILKDLNGVARTSGSIDVGAIEFSGVASGIAPPAAPGSTQLRILVTN